MVLKLMSSVSLQSGQFENDVKMYGTQTSLWYYQNLCKFENDVKMYGTQTVNNLSSSLYSFENDVKMYGTQTNQRKY